MCRKLYEGVAHTYSRSLPGRGALTFASKAKFEIEAKMLFRLEAKKKPKCETPKL